MSDGERVVGEVNEAAVPNSVEFIEPDPDLNDHDSAYEEGDASIRSASLATSVLNYRYENGRRYHAFNSGAYVLPNDEEEQDRLDLHHHVFRLSIGGALFRAPIDPNLQRALDIGTGTGIWAIEFADEFPSAEVIGIDLSPIQPGWVPPNLKFYVDDAESDWDYSPSDAFDFIHARAIGGSINDWDKLHDQIMQNLKPGGWVEIQEFEAELKSDYLPNLDKCPTIKQWQVLINDASRMFGKELNIAEREGQRLRDAGFINVRDEIYKIPVGSWPRDRKLKEIGRYQLAQASIAIEPFSLGYCVKVLQWTEEACRDLVTKVIAELNDQSNLLYIRFHFVYGQKPG